MKIKKRFLGILLSLALMLGMTPWMSLTAYADNVTNYNLSVGGTEVTSSNASNIVGDNTASYDATNNTLTLNGFNYNGIFPGILNNIDGLTVIIENTNTIGSYIVSVGSLNIKGNGTLKIEGAGGSAIHSQGDLTISESVNITADKSGTGIICGSLTLESTGEINVKGSISGLHSDGKIEITNGNVTAEGGTFGIGQNGGGAPLFIGTNAKLIAIGGDNGAIYYDTDSNYRTVQNDIAGVAWTNKEGTTDGQNIAVNSEGQPISNIYKKVEFSNSHIHSFTYSATGATITATCSDTSCALHSSPATLTLSATDTTYTGSAYTGASLTDTTAWTGAGLTVPTIEYEGHSNTSYTKSETAPTNAGTYTASITVGGKTATADFTITPIALTITGATATNRAYDKNSTAVTISAVTFENSSQQAVALTVGEEKDYTVTGAMSDANAGDGKTVNVTVTLKNANYSLATNTTTATVDIGKAGAQTIADMTDTLLYKATSVSESVAGKMPDDAGTLTYSVGSASKTGSVTVSNFAVNESGTVTATLSGGAAGDTVTLPVTIGSTNYADSTVNVKITLTAKSDAGVDITGVPASKTYGDADFTITGSVTNEGTGTGNWTWSTSDETVFQITPNGATATVKILKAGSAAVTAKYESDTTIDTETTAIAVNTMTLRITAKDQSIYVGGTVPTLSGSDFYTVTGLVGEDTLTTAPTLAYQKDGSAAAPDNTAAGTYDIVASGASAGDNYAISYTKGTLTISEKQPPTVTKAPEAKTLTYTGSAQSLVTAGSAEGGEMQYALGTDATTVPTDGWSESIPTGNEAKNYYVWYKAVGDNDHADSEAAVIEVTISEKAVTPEVRFDVTTMELESGQTGTIAVTVEPSDAVVTWSSDKETVATVDNTGKVTAVGAGTAKITVTINVAGTQYKAECTVTVTGSAPSETVPEISISDLSEATEGEAYNQTLTASGAQPITWAITAGSLPDGLALGSDTGVISGTPTSTGTSVFTVTASNSYGSVSKELSITVQAGNTIVAKEGTAPYDEKTSVENDPAEVRALVSGVTPVDESDTVKLILNTDSKDEGNLSDDEKEAVDTIKGMAEANGLTVGSFVDLTLIYEVTDANGALKSRDQIKETSRKIKVKFPIPPVLQKSGRLFSIFRFHDSGAQIIGQGSGDAVDVDTDKFSMYAIAYEDGAAPAEDSEKKVVRPHTHTYAWDKVEATEDRDGELRYQCTECYDILVRVPLSAYYVFNANTVDKITKAKQGETVKITTDRWISFHKMVFDALAARPDVSLEVSFLDGEYKGNRVSFTIPAGADSSDLFTENNFAGFMYLGNKYGLTAE
ncbi:Putative Ig domain-containing protein [Butyrivibrio sp. Su6]|uniref:beta strand repeat-containing protein n=1 Tax=Butyrivibrio sp. Su6 TaxID=1520810 RepID=UPI00089F8470|nr:putative Ig domain-containing protein [Butyrivibrio sp. Su6]SEF76824.1 Putative Ig domain-containing protein [Butyrivibrio sp. Su6]